MIQEKTCLKVYKPTYRMRVGVPLPLWEHMEPCQKSSVDDGRRSGSYHEGALTAEWSVGLC